MKPWLCFMISKIRFFFYTSSHTTTYIDMQKLLLNYISDKKLWELILALQILITKFQYWYFGVHVKRILNTKLKINIGVWLSKSGVSKSITKIIVTKNIITKVVTIVLGSMWTCKKK